MTKYADHVYDSSAVAEKLPNGISKYGKRIRAFWNWKDDPGNYKSADEAAAGAVSQDS